MNTECNSSQKIAVTPGKINENMTARHHLVGQVCPGLNCISLTPDINTKMQNESEIIRIRYIERSKK